MEQQSWNEIDLSIDEDEVSLKTSELDESVPSGLLEKQKTPPSKQTGGFVISCEVIELFVELLSRAKKQSLIELEEHFTQDQARHSIAIRQDELLYSHNPLARVLLAQNGFCEKELVDDPTVKVRIEILKSTGAYSDNYRKETDAEMIRELIIQGVDHEFFSKQHPSYQMLIEQSIEAISLQERIESGCLKTLDGITESFYEYESLAYNPLAWEMLEYAKIICQDAHGNPFEKIGADEMLISLNFIQENESILQSCPTPFGSYIGINQEAQSVVFEDDEGNEVLSDYHEVENYLNTFITK